MTYKPVSTFHYAGETFEVLYRITSGKWRGYLLCRTLRIPALCYFRED
jgi:hypothetical protein